MRGRRVRLTAVPGVDRRLAVGIEEINYCLDDFVRQVRWEARRDASNAFSGAPSHNLPRRQV